MYCGKVCQIQKFAHLKSQNNVAIDGKYVGFM